MSPSTSSEDLCDYCRNIIIDPIAVETDEETYRCCSEACKTALLEDDAVFTDHTAHRRFQPEIAGITRSLPEGIPRNSFILISGQTGTREEAIQVELVWRTLQRGESAIVIAFTEPPISVVENFLTMDWNVLPYLENDKLRIIDCFTYRVDDRDRLFDRLSPWNTHLNRITQPQTIPVRDINDGAELQNKLDNSLESQGMIESGMVIIDSLVEFGSLVQPIQAYNFIKDARAEVCKGRFVPIIASGIGSSDDQTFPQDLEYVVDGIIDLKFDTDSVRDTLLKQLRIRKMRGVLTISEWHTFEYTSGLGLVTFDPHEQIRERSEPDEESTEE